MTLEEFVNKFVPANIWYQVSVIDAKMVACFSDIKSVNQVMLLQGPDQELKKREVAYIAPRLKTVESNASVSYESYINIVVK